MSTQTLTDLLQSAAIIVLAITSIRHSRRLRRWTDAVVDDWKRRRGVL